MKKADKKKIEEKATKYASKFGGTLRFRKTEDPYANCYGYFDPENLECVVKCTDAYNLFDTICHELAHLKQYVIYGETNCDNGDSLSAQHSKFQTLIEDMFEATGFKNLVYKTA